MPDLATALSIVNSTSAPPPPSSDAPPPQFPATGGAPVPVDSTPAQQPSDFDWKMSVLQAASQGKLPAPPTQPKDEGVLANVAGGALSALTGAAGAGVDATTWLMRQKETGFGTLTPEQAVKSGADPALFNGTPSVGGSHWINQRLGDLGRSTGGWFGRDPETVVATDPTSQVARAAGAGAMSMAAPFAFTRALGFTGDLNAARTVPQAIRPRRRRPIRSR